MAAKTREEPKTETDLSPDAEDAPEDESDDHDAGEEVTVTDLYEERRAKLESKIAHLSGCPAERTETYEQLGPNGHVVVSRCQDCGGHLTQRPTEEPTLV